MASTHVSLFQDIYVLRNQYLDPSKLTVIYYEHVRKLERRYILTYYFYKSFIAKKLISRI